MQRRIVGENCPDRLNNGQSYTGACAYAPTHVFAAAASDKGGGIYAIFVLSIRQGYFKKHKLSKVNYLYYGLTNRKIGAEIFFT